MTSPPLPSTLPNQWHLSPPQHTSKPPNQWNLPPHTSKPPNQWNLSPPGHFNIAGPGSLWKKQEKEEDYNVEVRVLKELNESSIRSYVPDYLGCKEYEGIKWIGMEDLMCHFQDGCGMDIKMDTRWVYRERKRGRGREREREWHTT